MVLLCQLNNQDLVLSKQRSKVSKRTNSPSLLIYSEKNKFFPQDENVVVVDKV
jgi:hypothetical protein